MELLDAIRIVPQAGATLGDRDTRDTLGLEDKDHARDQLDELQDEAYDLQRRLWAEDARAILLVLQGMDTAGKDSTIRRVLGPLNPHGVRVTSFGVPDRRGARPRLPLAHPPGLSGPRHHRGLQPVALRGRRASSV